MSEKKQPRQRSGSMLVRLSLIVGGIGLVLLIGGIIAFTVTLSSRNVPLEVEVYPDAEELGHPVISEGHDWLHYVSDSPTEEVMAFYQERIADCNRRNNDRPSPGDPPYEFRCVVDGSFLFSTQSTIVIVQPGVQEYAGRTRISMERMWGQ